MTQFDPEALAVEAILKLNSVIEKTTSNKSSTKCSPLARRAEELPQLMLQTGLLQTILFYLSKSNPNLLASLLKAMNDATLEDDAKKDLQEECTKEGKGYTLGITLVAYALNSLREAGLLGEASASCNELESFQGIARCLLALRRNNLDLRVERLVEPYLSSTKRLAEALYKEKEE